MDLKVCLEKEKLLNENTTDSTTVSKKSKGSFDISKSCRHDSVQELFLISLGKGVQELYKNFKVIFDELGLWGLHCYPAKDF